MKILIVAIVAVMLSACSQLGWVLERVDSNSLIAQSVTVEYIYGEAGQYTQVEQIQRAQTVVDTASNYIVRLDGNPNVPAEVLAQYVTDFAAQADIRPSLRLVAVQLAGDIAEDILDGASTPEDAVVRVRSILTTILAQAEAELVRLQ